MASGCLDGTVKLWDVATGQLAITLKGHTGAVMSMAFSPDGHRLVSVATDGVVRKWDARPMP